MIDNQIDKQIEFASNLIKNGKLVSFPTETVYGLGADATNQDACLAIYKIKNRPTINPLIVHVESLEKAEKIAIFNDSARMIVKQFWPGPITIVLPINKNSNIKLANCVTAGLDTVAVRIPANKIALKLIIKSGCPIAAPSANYSGYVSSTSKDHVESDFKDLFVINDNTKNPNIGIESTILDLSTQIPRILRPGFITTELIHSILKYDIGIDIKEMVLKAPGMMKSHYATHNKIRLNALNLQYEECGIGFGNIDFGELNLSISSNLAEAAANLYKFLRISDNKYPGNTIAIAPIPNDGIGVAINDRLKRAANQT